jgi:hypothetical protein
VSGQVTLTASGAPEPDFIYYLTSNPNPAALPGSAIFTMSPANNDTDQVVNISSDSLFYLFAESPEGCLNPFPDTLLVSAFTIPNLTFTPVSACDTVTIGVPAQPGFVYSWNTVPPQTTSFITVNATGNYELTISNPLAVGCETSGIQQVTKTARSP